MTKQASPGCSLAIGLAFGGIFALTGAYIVGISLGFLPSDPEDFSAPRLVVAAAGMCFFIGGVWAALKSTSWAYGQDTPAVKRLSFFLTLVMMIAFASVFLWAGIGPGERQFQTSTSVGGVTISSPGNESAGRCIFGGFGFLAASGTVYYALTQPLKIMGKMSDKKTGPKEMSDD
jgi:hypothetical protein